MIRNLVSWLKPVVRNYYLMTGLVFIVWMLFFDSNNMFVQYRNKQELKELVLQKNFYVSEIRKNKTMISNLTSPNDLQAVEKFAREKYLMKKPNEDIFLIVNEDAEEN